MELLLRIQEEMKLAMREKKEKELSALRQLSAAIKNEEIAKRPEALKEEDVMVVIKREVKKLNDAIADFEKGGRADLVEDYKEQIKTFSRYLPAEMGEEEVRRIVKESIAFASDKNFGAVMKAAMAALKGQADGGLVSRIVKEELGS
jgi:hypothetical protein